MKRIAVYGENVQNTQFDIGMSKVSLFYRSGDHKSVRRVTITTPSGTAELLPSKALALHQYTPVGCDPLFWESPVDNLTDPDTVDVTKTVLVNGDPVEAMSWIEYFCSGVELMGLENWGVPVQNEREDLLPLHGNVTFVPVHSVEISSGEKQIAVSAVYPVYPVLSAKGAQTPEGPLFFVHRRVTLSETDVKITLKDTIINVSGDVLTPDWGYHIQLRPEPGCTLSVPAEHVEGRFGEDPEPDFNIWNPAKDENIREERGYVFTGIKESENQPESFNALVDYPSGYRVEMQLPLSAFVMGWFSCGGKEGAEFTLEDGTSLSKKSWNGIGPEIGASALDHTQRQSRGNRPAKPLAPGEKLSLKLEFTRKISR